MAPPASDGLTIRISNLPPETEANDVRRFFDSRVGKTGTVVASNGVGQVITQAKRTTKQTTVTFTTSEWKKKAIQVCHDTRFSAERGNGTRVVSVEDEFMGLTPLFVSESGTPNLDIVVLHGLRGHAWDSFASTHDSQEGVKETCWLRDELPTFLEEQRKGIRPRVMTYGYHANVWINSTVEGLEAPVADLINSLEVAREDHARPLIFIGHSLGGIVIKQVIDQMITPNKQTDPAYVTPIKGCLFLAVPHRGTGNADFLKNLLNLLDKALLPGMGPNKKFVKDLELKNKKLADITDRFIQLLNGNSISVISCYENRDYTKGKGRIVSRESATLDYAGRKHHPHPIDANHSDCARFGNAAQHPFDQIASELTGIAAAAISDVEHRPRTSLPSGQLQSLTHENSADSVPTLPMARLSLEPAERGVEPVYFKLTRYNTVFLVDDSSSMEDLYQPELNISSSNWSDTTHALEECAKIILGARGRLKVHFFNDLDRYNDNVSGVSDIRELCRFRPRGDTPTYQRLKRHLDEYLEAFLPLNARQREAYSGLNLIIFTDGAPEGRFDDIEEVIVDAATDLDTTRADKYKVGIQFVQIGNDESVTKFFDRIDNEIKGEHRLRRDMVDTTRYHQPTANESVYRKIILGAIDKDQDGKSSSLSSSQLHYDSGYVVAQHEIGSSSATHYYTG